MFHLSIIFIVHPRRQFLHIHNLSIKSWCLPCGDWEVASGGIYNNYHLIISSTQQSGHLSNHNTWLLFLANHIYRLFFGLVLFLFSPRSQLLDFHISSISVLMLHMWGYRRCLRGLSFNSFLFTILGYHFYSATIVVFLIMITWIPSSQLQLSQYLITVLTQSQLSILFCY